LALTPQNNEAFLREVDEELRRDQIGNFWRRYGKWLAVLLVVGLAAFGAWLWWQNDQRQKAGLEGEQLDTALAQLTQNQPDAAAPALEALAKSERPGYRAAAKLALADMAMAKQDLSAAAAGFRAVSEDQTLAKPYRDLALVRQTAAEFDRLEPAVVIERLAPLAKPGNPWFGSAGEMVAIAHMRANQPKQAGELFARIGNDQAVPPTIRSRAVQMAGLLGVDAVDQTNESAPK